MPQQNLPFDSAYVVAENKGLGSLSHEYSVTDTTMHIHSYFTVKDTNQKIKILHISKECSFDTLYTLAENILHIWYGGRYAKSSDTYSTPGTPHCGWESSLTSYIRSRISAFSSYCPPMDPYPAERNTFVNNAQKGADQSQEYLPFIQQKIKEDQQARRLEFNQQIVTHIASRSATSDIFKAAQQLDVCFKIVDGLLTLMYNDLTTNQQHALYPELTALKDEEDLHNIKNMAAITKYIQQYSLKNNPEHSQGNYLPFYIKDTTSKLIKALNAITTRDCKPQFNSVTRVINNIEGLIGKYRMRNITPRPQILAAHYEESELLAIVQNQNNQIAQLVQETKATKEELSDVKKQLQAMMALLLEMKNAGK